MVYVRITLADIFRHMGEVGIRLAHGGTFSRSMNRGPSVFRAEQVPWVRLAVQQLLGGATVGDRYSPSSQRVAEKLSVPIRERGSEVAARHELFSLCNSIREVRRRDQRILLHPGMQQHKGVRVVRW